MPIYGHRAMNSTLGRVSVASIGSPRQALASTDRAITNVANERGKMGAVQNRLDVTIAYTENEIESIQASEASIRDADIAAEVTEFSRRQILLQSTMRCSCRQMPVRWLLCLYSKRNFLV